MIFRLTFFISLLILVACKTTSINRPDTFFSITKTSADEYNSVIELKYLVRDTLNYNTKNHIIKLPLQLKWKPYAIFKDTLFNSDDERVRRFEYLGQYKYLGFYLVQASFWEHSEKYLVNKYTGEKTTVWDEPKLSPRRKYFADILGYGMDGEPVGVQIWKITVDENGGFKLSNIVEINQQLWTPVDFVWANDNSLILKINTIQLDHPPSKNFDYLKIRLP